VTPRKEQAPRYPAKPRPADWEQFIDGWGTGPLSEGSIGDFWASGFLQQVLPTDPPEGWVAEVRADFQLEFASVAGTLEITEVRITPGPFRVGGITADDLRLLRLHQAAREVLDHIRNEEPSDWFGHPALDVMPPREWATTLSTRPGQHGRDELDYALVAAKYISHLGSRQPVVDVAEELYLSTSQVRNILYEARTRGLLTGKGQGKPGGELTPKALDLLRHNDQGTEQ
jgi:hypothetical protein